MLAPDFAMEFKLAVDAIDTGTGVLMQEDGNGVDNPVSYFSKTFILALQHFEVYLTSSSSPTVAFSDHNPLTFTHRMKNKNQSGVCCYRNIILTSGTSGTSKEKTKLLLMHCLEPDALISCNLLFIRD